MEDRQVRRLPELAAVSLAFVLAACGGASGGITGDGGGGGGGGGSGSGGGGSSNSISVADNSFTPAKDTVAKGTQVTWTWRGAALHSVTFDDGPSSETMAAGSYARTFDTAGTYPYHCKVHGTSMSGSVTVQ